MSAEGRNGAHRRFSSVDCHRGQLPLSDAEQATVRERSTFVQRIETVGFMESARMLAEHPEVDVGIHLAITSEWDNVKWRPLTACRRLTEANGFFPPMTYPNTNYAGRSLLDLGWTMEDVESEFRAQIELTLEAIPHASHLTGHMGCTAITEDVAALTRRLADDHLTLVVLQVQILGGGGVQLVAAYLGAGEGRGHRRDSLQSPRLSQ